MKKKLIFLFLIVSFVEADYTVKVVVKFPFASVCGIIDITCEVQK